MKRHNVSWQGRAMRNFYRRGESKKIRRVCDESGFDYPKAIYLMQNIDKGNLSFGKIHEILLELGINDNEIPITRKSIP